MEFRRCTKAHLWTQVVNNWRTELADTPLPTLFARFGATALLYSGTVLAGKLAALTHRTTSSHLRTEAALLGAKLVAAAFAGSHTHPQRAAGFAEYAPVTLCEGCDLFADARALSAADVATGAEGVALALLDADEALAALAVVALWEWVSARVLRDAALTVRARLARARACSALGFAGAAYATVTALMTGAALPGGAVATGDLVHLTPDGAPAEPRNIPPFDETQLPGHSANTAALTFLAAGGVDAPVATQLGPWAAARLTLERCRLLHLLGGVPYSFRKTHASEGRPLGDADSPPAAVERRLLEQARDMLASLVECTTAGLPFQQAPAVEESGKGAKGSKGKDVKGGAAAKGGKGAAATAGDAAPASAGTEAWQVDVLVDTHSLV